MKKIAILMMALLVTINCRSRKKIVSKLDYEITEQVKTDTNTVTSTEKKVEQQSEINKVIKKKDAENFGDIIIKGKTDTVKDFHFHNIVKGDTLADIFISGNADFIIKNRWRENQTEEKQVEKKEELNLVADLARKSVAASTIKAAAGKIVEADKEIKSTGFSLPIYLIGAGLLTAALAFYLFFGDIKKIFNKLT